MSVKSKNMKSDRRIAFWRASSYLEILNERVPLVDKWRDGSVNTWHPSMLGEKLLWYSGVPNTPRNRRLAHDWLMQNCTEPVKGTVAHSVENKSVDN